MLASSFAGAQLNGAAAGGWGGLDRPSLLLAGELDGQLVGGGCGLSMRGACVALRKALAEPQLLGACLLYCTAHAALRGLACHPQCSSRPGCIAGTLPVNGLHAGCMPTSTPCCRASTSSMQPIQARQASHHPAMQWAMFLDTPPHSSTSTPLHNTLNQCACPWLPLLLQPWPYLVPYAAQSAWNAARMGARHAALNHAVRGPFPRLWEAACHELLRVGLLHCILTPMCLV